MLRLIPNLFNAIRPSVQALPTRQLHIASTTSAVQSPISNEVAGGAWGLMLVRNIIRYHFPRPSERKRIKRHGWFTRMSTPEGRRVLMRRILKGRHVLSH